jgi:hypothetical protein
MALTADIIAGHPALHGAIRQQSRLLLEAYEANPRLASVFATQQRWLMAQTALALHFRIDAAVQPGGLTAARFFEAIARNGVASRNTADAFVKEMLKYGYVQRAAAGATDRRTHPLEPTQASIDAVRGSICRRSTVSTVPMAVAAGWPRSSATRERSQPCSR